MSNNDFKFLTRVIVREDGCISDYNATSEPQLIRGVDDQLSRSVAPRCGNEEASEKSIWDLKVCCPPLFLSNAMAF